jgi:hypothetical protein
VIFVISDLSKNTVITLDVTNVQTIFLFILEIFFINGSFLFGTIVFMLHYFLSAKLAVIPYRLLDVLLLLASNDFFSVMGVSVFCICCVSICFLVLISTKGLQRELRGGFED